MFKKLFKPKWQSAKPHVRIQAVAQLNAADIDDLHIIEVLAKNDVESDVRLAATEKITDQEKLISILQQEKNPDVRIKMIEHLMSLLPDDKAVDTRLQKLLQGLDGQALAGIVEHTKSAALGVVAMESISDEKLLSDYALNLPLAAMRQQAVEKVNDEALLEAIEKASKGKDKSVFRIARNKLQEIREALKKEENLEQQIDTICLNMDQLARGADDPMYQTKVYRWHMQWTRIEMHASADDSQRFNRAYELCRQMVNEAQQEENALKEQVQQERAAQQERMAACEQLESTLTQLKEATAVQSTDIPALSALLKTQQNRWQEAAQEVAPEADERKRFNRTFTVLDKALQSMHWLSERTETLTKAAHDLLDVDDANTQQLLDLKKKLDKAAKGLEWPDEIPAPEELQLVHKANRSFEALRNKAVQKENEAIGNLKQLLDKLDTAIKEGSLKPANKLLGDAQKWVKHIPIRSAQQYQKELRSYAARVNELRDWQGFAVLPKKEQLCTQMESLVGVEMDPQELANRVQRLQKEWKSLGYAKEGQELWERFSEAAEKAYEPCKAYFENLAEIRHKNLQAREQVVVQLNDYLQQFDFSQADWVAVNQVYETAKQEWRQYSPVERKAGKDIQERFNQLLDELRGKLSEEWNRNKQQREELIARAEALIEEGDLAKAIDEAKGLQRQWKDTGMVARRDENKLWKRFRGACDKIFERRDHERQVAEDERQKNLSEANHVIELIEHLSDSETMTVAESQKEFAQLQKRFSDLKALPKDHYDDVKKRYQAVCDRFMEGVKVAQAAAQKAQVARLWQVMSQLDQMEANWVEQAADTQAQLDLSSEINIEGNDGLSRGLQDRHKNLKNLMAAGESPQASQLQNNADQLRALCIQLEIAAGVDSPQQDQQQRMELQVSRLSNGLAQREQREGVADQVFKLQQQWCDIGPAPTQARAEYTKRFVEVLKQIGEL